MAKKWCVAHLFIHQSSFFIGSMKTVYWQSSQVATCKKCSKHNYWLSESSWKEVLYRLIFVTLSSDEGMIIGFQKFFSPKTEFQGQ
jgi:hypothetical protein